MSSSRESVVRREEGHPGRALGNMASLRLAKSLCDVTVQAGGHQFDAHRVVLSASSAYFRAMFTGCMEESLQRVVVIRLVYKNIATVASLSYLCSFLCIRRDVPGPILGQLIDYCYTSAVEVTERNVQALLAAADQLQLPWVVEVACEFLQHRLESSNCLSIASLADTHSCPSLQAAADAIALHSFPEVQYTLYWWL